ncbi:MAG TPA: hypothetical protein VE978_06830 [Chitinophagales bacterium]|nr:hypothetical protein [Chitinophagales bacterium]
MKKNYSLIIVLISLCAISASSKKKTFTAWIIQDNQKVEVNNNEVTLLKKPFVIQLALNKIEGVSVNISFDRTFYDPAAAHQIYDVANLDPKTLVEDTFNIEKELFVSSEYLCYWFYNTKLRWHRMDRDIVINGTQVICNKTVEKIFESDTQEEYKIENISKDLFLVFASTKDKGYPAVPKVIDINRIKITWAK